MITIIHYKPNSKSSIKGIVSLMFLFLSVVAHATVVTYPQLSGIQACQFSYTLKAKDHSASTWQTVALYNAQVTNAAGGQTNTTVGEFDCSGSTDIQITFSTTVTKAAVYPALIGATPTISGNTITFTIARPQKFYVDINGDHYNNCIHVMANPLEVNPPSASDTNVVYIPTGTYNSNVITLTSGKTLYVQGGAAVGGVVADNVSNVTIRGRGFIWRATFNALEVHNSTNVTIEGLTDLNHGWGGNGGAGLHCAQSTNVNVTNTASFSSKKWGDGYDIFCSNGVAVNGVFIRTNDDAIAFYGGGKSGYTGDCRNLSVVNSTLAPDLAHSFHVGVYGDTAGVGKQIRDVVVANVDILNQSRTTSQGCIYFTVGDKVRAANFKFSNVRVQDFRNSSFITMAIVNNGSYNWFPGRAIDSVYYTNCSYSDTGSTVPPSSINGYDATRKTTNVFFQNLKVNGTTITSASAGNFSIGSNTSNITFGTLPITLGNTYVLKAQVSGLVANPSGGSSSSGTNIVQNYYGGSTYQQWILTDAGNGFYYFKNANNGLYLNISGGSTAPNANLVQATYDSSPNSQFLVVPQNGGYYNIMPRHSGLVLTVNNASRAAGEKIIQWNYVLPGATYENWSFDNP